MKNSQPPHNPMPTGMPGGMGVGPAGVDRPPRPLWETLVIFACGLSLGLFFFPDSVVHEQVKLGVGVAATVILFIVFLRRKQAVQGMMADGEQPKLGGPKPYHAARKFDPKKH